MLHISFQLLLDQVAHDFLLILSLFSILFDIRDFDALELQSKTDKFLWNVHFHNHDDLPDANMQPSISFERGHNSQYVYQLQTKHYSKASTKSKPCRKYHPTACKEVELHKKIAKFHNCTIPIFYSGQHLDELILGGYNFSYFIFYWDKNNFYILKTHFRTSTLQHKCNKVDDTTNWQAI